MTKTEAAIAHIKTAWDAGITVGVNPPGLLRTAVELADQRTPATNIAGAVYALEAARHMLKAVNDTDPTAPLFRMTARLSSLAEEMQLYAVTGEGL